MSKSETNMTSAPEPHTSLDELALDALVPPTRPRKAIHPESTKLFNYKPSELTTTHLSVQSSYSEFAWEFLRRNRFYKALVDRHEKHLTELQWGYRWRPEVSRTHGLVRIKPYTESYAEGEPPAWMGLDSFAEQLPTKVGLRSESVSIELRPGQVAVVFDLAGLIHGQSPWDIQLWTVRDRFIALCNDQLQATVISGKPQHRKALLRRLRMFDLLDEGRDLADATSILGYRRRRPIATIKGSPNPFSAGHLQLGKLEPVTSAFEDANAAYDLVYRHQYLDVLRGERNYTLIGNRLIPYAISDKGNDQLE
jgi:hypothetical protein